MTVSWVKTGNILIGTLFAVGLVQCGLAFGLRLLSAR